MAGGTVKSPQPGRAGRKLPGRAPAAPQANSVSVSSDSNDSAAELETGASTQAGHRHTSAQSPHNDDRSKHCCAQMLADSALDEGELRRVFARQPRPRLTETLQIKRHLQAQWPLWHLLLRSGSSVLLYGLGSKREHLNAFVQQQLTDGAVVVVAGYLPCATAHKAVAAVTSALLHKSSRGQSTAQLLAELAAEARQWPDRRVYLVVHSMDGAGLSQEGNQEVLAALAALPNCHLLASCDRMNCALMWSPVLAAQFRWHWVQAHTYEPYLAETLDQPSALLACFQRSRQRGAGAVLRALVGAGREVFKLLAGAQQDDPDSEGMDFKQLFRMCRERFLVTSEAALRSTLHELFDHEVLSTRQASDGSGEVLFIPLDKAALERTLQELDSIQVEGEESM